MLAHQRGHVSIGDVVAAKIAPGRCTKEVPKALPFARAAHVRKGKEVGHVRHRISRRQWTREDAWVGSDPQVAHERRPEEVQEVRSGCEPLHELTRRPVAGSAAFEE